MKLAEPSPCIKNATLDRSLPLWNYYWNQSLDPFIECTLLIRGMPKCNIVLQSENDLFEPEVKPNSPEIANPLCSAIRIYKTVVPRQ